MSEYSESFGAISDVVRTYVEGMVHGDSAKLETAFHENACVIGHWDGALGWATLAEFREEDTSDRHVDPNAERVRTDDELEQAALSEALDQQSILRQQPRVVQSDPGRQKPTHILAVRGVEPE